MASVLSCCLASVACGGHNATPGGTSVPTTNATPVTPSGSPAFSTASIDECALVTPADLTRIIGVNFANPGSATGDLCVFVGDGPTQVGIQTYDLAISARDLFELVPKQNSYPILTSPGDEAYWSDLTGAAVLSGQIELTTRIIRSGTGPSDRDASFAVAAAAVAKLP